MCLASSTLTFSLVCFFSSFIFSPHPVPPPSEVPIILGSWCTIPCCTWTCRFSSFFLTARHTIVYPFPCWWTFNYDFLPFFSNTNDIAIHIFTCLVSCAWDFLEVVISGVGLLSYREGNASLCPLGTFLSPFFEMEAWGLKHYLFLTCIVIFLNNHNEPLKLVVWGKRVQNR